MTEPDKSVFFIQDRTSPKNVTTGNKSTGFKKAVCTPRVFEIQAVSLNPLIFCKLPKGGSDPPTYGGELFNKLNERHPEFVEKVLEKNI